MKKVRELFQTNSIGFIITASCVSIVVVLVVSIFIATLTSFRTSTAEAISNQTGELSTQIMYNYENYFDTVIKISNTIQTDIDRFNVQEQTEADAFSDYLESVVHLKADIVRIAVYDYDTGRCLCTSNGNEQNYNAVTDRETWFAEAASDPTVHAFSVPYSESGSGEYRINISKVIKYNYGASLGVLKIEIRFQTLIDLIHKSNLGKDGHVTIVDPGYNIIYTSLSETESNGEIDEIRSIVLGSKNVMIGGHNMAVNVNTLSGTNWRICVFINIDNLTAIQQNFVGTTLLVSAVVLVAGILLFLFVSRQITNPLKQLEQAMRKVEKSDYFKMEQVDIQAFKEVNELTRRFNKLMKRIDDLMERVKVEQNAQRKSELKALQNQINPHFLYNTLDSILWLIENEKNEEASEMVVALARLFRISISKNREVISVRDEIEHVRNYLLIQSIRYSNAFDYEFEVDSDALDLPTMKLILQPLVENSIYHGLKNKIDKGHIKVSVKVEGNFIVFRVSDNGYGIKASKIEELLISFKDSEPSDGVGLKNIYQRVSMYYLGNGGMEIESVLDEGTTIIIKEPIGEK